MAKSKNFVPKPVYPGGMRAMNAFIKKHLRYPEAAKAVKLEGTIRVNYSLDQSGRVVKVKAVEGPKDGGLREEAERVVKMLKFEIPKERKLRIQYHQHLDVHFKLPKPKLNPKKLGSSTQIKYTITKRVEPKEGSSTAEEPKGDDYSYTIRW